jgi:DUF177 domain-containing protein
MNELRIRLSALSGLSTQLSVEVSQEDLRPEGATALDLAPVTVKGALEAVEDAYIFRGVVSGAFRGSCDRCLERAELPFALEVLWSFGDEVDGSSESDEKAFDTAPVAYSGDEIDLAPKAWEEIVLAAPAKVLCRSDCAGLCPECGRNLNAESCDCEVRAADEARANSGFADLADLFPELKKKTED